MPNYDEEAAQNQANYDQLQEEMRTALAQRERAYYAKKPKRV